MEYVKTKLCLINLILPANIFKLQGQFSTAKVLKKIFEDHLNRNKDGNYQNSET